MSDKLPITNADFATLLDRATRKVETLIAKGDEVIRKGRTLGMGNSTIIHGRAEWKTCWRYACYLSKYIYKDPPSPDGFHTRFPEQMALVEKHWEEWDELVDQTESGLVARLFKVKGYDPDNKSLNCAPTLVFRGTDFDDMRDLAIDASIRLHLGLLFWTFNKIYVLDNTLDPESTRGQLLEKGFEAIPIYKDYGFVSVQGATDWTGLPLITRPKLDILAKENGDWANNIRQGLGKGSEQYKDSFRYGRKIVDKKIMPGRDKRLELTGHSLGGGLASATCAFLDKLYPDVNFHAIVFNPAGVHPNTIKPATPANGLIHVFAVKDEILTTLQSFREQIPFVGAIFRLAKRTINQDGMPEALGNMLLKEGFSPGKSKEQWAVPAKGDAVPMLFPIDQQTLIPWATPTRFPELRHLDEMLRNSPSISAFADELLRHINTTYRNRAKATVEKWWGTVYTLDDLYLEMFRYYQQDLEPELKSLEKIIQASVDYHGMDYVMATYEHHYGQL